MRCVYLFLAVCVLGVCVLVQPSFAEEYLNGIKWQEPKVVTPSATKAGPPSDAIVLFNGKNLDNWENGENWPVKDGVMYSGEGPIRSKEVFGDCQLHVEWSSPIEVKGDGQGRGNSGVFLMGIYEIQVLDSFNNPTYFDGQAGAIYKQTPPMVNAMRGPGEWNSYDIFWTAPRFQEDGSLETPAYMTAIHNGVLILNHFRLQGDTPYSRPPSYKQHSTVGPIGLQDHGNPVRFRNIWVRPLAPIKGERVRPAYIKDGDKEVDIEAEEEKSTTQATTLETK